jgi:hypothetical protein
VAGFASIGLRRACFERLPSSLTRLGRETGGEIDRSFLGRIDDDSPSDRLIGHPLQRSQVELAGAQNRDRVDLVELVALGQKQVGKLLGARGVEGMLDLTFVGRVQDDELPSLLFVTHGRNCEELAFGADGFVERLFDQEVRNHPAADQR